MNTNTILSKFHQKYAKSTTYESRDISKHVGTILSSQMAAHTYKPYNITYSKSLQHQYDVSVIARLSTSLIWCIAALLGAWYAWSPHIQVLVH